MNPDLPLELSLAKPDTRRSAYLQTLNKRIASQGKLAARERVASLIKECIPRRLQMITLPGPAWTFENQLFEHYGREGWFTAFEQDLGLMHRGLVNVPRCEYRKGESHLDRNSRWCEWQSLGVKYFHTNRARWFHCDFNAWATVNPKDQKAVETIGVWDGRSPHEIWQNKFWGCNAVWLDYTGCLSPLMEQALSRLPLLMKPNWRFDAEARKLSRDEFVRMPIAVTLLKAREQPTITRRLRDLGISRGQYLHFLLDRLPGWKLDEGEVFEYLSDGGAPMMLWTSTYRKP